MRSRLAACVLAALVGISAAPASAAEPDPDEIHARQQSQGGRSGFWTSRAPASGGAYRWRLLAIGVGLVLVAGTGALVLVKRTRRDNAPKKPGEPRWKNEPR